MALLLRVILLLFVSGIGHLPLPNTFNVEKYVMLIY